MKEIYESAEMEVVVLKSEDIITDSCGVMTKPEDDV